MMIEERTKANVRVLKLAYGGLLVALGICCRRRSIFSDRMQG